MSDFISVIIPTYNSEKFIENCLNAIKNQSYKKFEVIIVDQKSTDNTVKIAKKFKAKIILVDKPKFYSPPSKSRNIGAKSAKGDIYFHLDSDMQPSKLLFEEIVDLFAKDKKTGALIVHEEDITDGFWSECKALERRCYWGDTSIESARVVRASIFKKIGGYDESISSGEDFDTQSKYQKVCEVGFCKNVVYHNLKGLNLKKDLIKKFNYGKTASQYFEKSKRSGGSILKTEFKMFIINYRLLLKQPIKAFGMLFMKALEFGVGGVGYIFK